MNLEKASQSLLYRLVYTSYTNHFPSKNYIACRDTIGRIPTNQNLLGDLLEMLGEFRNAISSGYTRQIYTETQLKKRQNLFVSSAIDERNDEVRVIFLQFYFIFFCFQHFWPTLRYILVKVYAHQMYVFLKQI